MKRVGSHPDQTMFFVGREARSRTTATRRTSGKQMKVQKWQTRDGLLMTSMTMTRRETERKEERNRGTWQPKNAQNLYTRAITHLYIIFLSRVEVRQV